MARLDELLTILKEGDGSDQVDAHASGRSSR